MSTPDLRDRLDDLAHDPATQVRIDARAAWAHGARRRGRRRVAVGTAGAAAIAALVAAVPLTRDVDLAPAARERTERADHHPQRLDHVYLDRAMPAITGPLAGVVQRSGDGIRGWYAVSPTGRMWHIDDAHDIPVPSPDGVHLAYLRGSEYRNAVFAITDQVTGEVVRFPEVSLGVTVNDKPTTDATYFHSDQMPRFWSPEGDAVLVRIGAIAQGTPEPAAAIASVSGDLTIIPDLHALPDGANPIGWFDDETIAFVSSAGKQARVFAVDVSTLRVNRSFLLDARPEFVSQWYASLSPDGRTVMTIDDSDGDSQVPVRFHAAEGATAGEVTVKMPMPRNHGDHCQKTWTSREVYLPVFQAEDSAAVLHRVNGGTPIVGDPRLEVVCSVWAASALEGGPDPSIGGWLFGTQDTWLSWHWRELTSGILAGLTLIAVAFAVRRRRRR